MSATSDSIAYYSAIVWFANVLQLFNYGMPRD